MLAAVATWPKHCNNECILTNTCIVLGPNVPCVAPNDALWSANAAELHEPDPSGGFLWHNDETNALR